MFNKIVWATDGSDAADQALPFVKKLAGEGDGELVVVHCEELTFPGKAGGRFPRAANEDELQQKIRQQVQQLSGNGVHATLQMARVSVGGAAQVIAEATRELHGDVIVVGTRGHTPLGGLLVGSVTQRLLHIAPCPVIAVPTRNQNGNA
jgi:nucleotide-binding universal stress UspA family protein